MVLSTFSLQVVTRIKGGKIYQNILLNPLCIEGIPHWLLSFPYSSSITSEESLRHNSEPRCQRRKKKNNIEMTESRLNNISICWSIETGKNGQKIIKDIWQLALVSISHMNDGVGFMHMCGRAQLSSGASVVEHHTPVTGSDGGIVASTVRPFREHCATSGSHRFWKGTLIHHYFSRDINLYGECPGSMASDWGTLGVKSRRLR